MAAYASTASPWQGEYDERVSIDSYVLGVAADSESKDLLGGSDNPRGGDGLSAGEDLVEEEANPVDGTGLRTVQA
jgi:hypothetical protein